MFRRIGQLTLLVCGLIATSLAWVIARDKPSESLAEGLARREAGSLLIPGSVDRCYSQKHQKWQVLYSVLQPDGSSQLCCISIEY